MADASPWGSPAIPGVEDLVPIGRGGFGVVYRGRQPELGREVAVKVISSPGTPEAAVERWRREVTAMGRLSNHPNILAVYAGGVTEDGSPYLVMPYVPGGSLREHLQREGPMSPAEVVALGTKLASALATAHAAGVLHRDVKPDNVLLSPYGEPQLTDFGIARLLDATTTAAGAVHATIPYAAPEVLSGQPAAEASDVYGLAATMYACLTGTPPFPSTGEDSLVALIGRIASQPPASLRDRGVPGELASVVERGLAKTPAQRVATARELARRLEAAGEAMARGSGGMATAPVAAAPQATDEATAVQPAAERTTAIPVARDAVPAGDGGDPPSGPAGPHGRRPPRRPWVATAFVALLVAAFVGLVTFALAQDGDGDGTAAPPEAPATSETTEPAPTTTSTTEPPATTTTTTEPPTTTEAGGGDAEAMASAATAYFEAIGDGDLDASYAMLSPGFRQAQSQESYEGFWGEAGPVEVVGPAQVDEDAGTATVPITIDGRRQDFRLRLVEQGGEWLVDGPRPG